LSFKDLRENKNKIIIIIITIKTIILHQNSADVQAIDAIRVSTQNG
jgi:hypothetical protein